mmetsp:Transcript_12125/g.17972  ORF Transcript_12125/g.17972 Transcript_12125/m.17972 type:complete len:240 (-) Transcript_12125:34-753(-)
MSSSRESRRVIFFLTTAVPAAFREDASLSSLLLSSPLVVPLLSVPLVVPLLSVPLVVPLLSVPLVVPLLSVPLVAPLALLLSLSLLLILRSSFISLGSELLPFMLECWLPREDLLLAILFRLGISGELSVELLLFVLECWLPREDLLLAILFRLGISLTSRSTLEDILLIGRLSSGLLGESLLDMLVSPLSISVMEDLRLTITFCCELDLDLLLSKSLSTSSSSNFLRCSTISLLFFSN